MLKLSKKQNTVFKQLNYHIHIQNVNRDEIIDAIRQNCIDNMIILCKLIGDVSTVSSLQNLSVVRIKNKNDNKTLQLLFKIISYKWCHCPMIKYKYVSDANLIDVDMEYFYDKIDEIMNSNYIPSHMDMIKHNKIKSNDEYYTKIKEKYNNSQYGKNNTIYYKEKDAIKLFTIPVHKKAKIGFTINIPEIFKHRFFDPINKNRFVKKLKVQKIFNSKTRPVLIDCYVEDSNDSKSEILSSQYIVKKGDDMRFDFGILQMFNKMNEIWQRNGLNIKATTYKCIPIGNNVGIIEMKPNCISLNRILELNDISRDKFLTLINSCVGAFIAGYICGVGDRHYDNILIDKQTAELFHIDFGFIFGDKPIGFDAYKIPITEELKQMFDIYEFGWNEFVRNAFKAWLIIRDNAKELIILGKELFSFNTEYNKSNKIELFLTDSLKLNMSTHAAKKYIYNELQNSPHRKRTKMKNFWHNISMFPISSQKVLLNIFV